jgi:hypothetical protein
MSHPRLVAMTAPGAQIQGRKAWLNCVPSSEGSEGGGGFV